MPIDTNTLYQLAAKALKVQEEIDAKNKAAAQAAAIEQAKAAAVSQAGGVPAPWQRVGAPTKPPVTSGTAVAGLTSAISEKLAHHDKQFEAANDQLKRVQSELTAANAQLAATLDALAAFGEQLAKANTRITELEEQLRTPTVAVTPPSTLWYARIITVTGVSYDKAANTIDLSYTLGEDPDVTEHVYIPEEVFDKGYVRLTTMAHTRIRRPRMANTLVKFPRDMIIYATEEYRAALFRGQGLSLVGKGITTPPRYVVPSDVPF